MAKKVIIKVHKLTKPLKKIKTLAGLAMAIAIWPGTVSAVPVRVAWQLPLHESGRYILQLSREPGFNQLLLNRLVDGQAWAWDTPEEGVFHWRLLRPGKTGSGVEGSTFVSGSFVAVAAGERAKAAVIRWQAVDNADRYKIYFVDAAGRTRTMVSSTTALTLPVLHDPVMIEVVPYSGAQRTFRDFHLQPSLQFEPGDAPSPKPLPKPLPAAATVVATTAGGATALVKSPGAVGDFRVAPGSGGAKTVSEIPAVSSKAPASPSPVAAPLATVPPPSAQPLRADSTAVAAAVVANAAAPTVSDDATGRRRRHLLYGFMLFEEDRLSFNQLDLELKSRQGALGAGAGFWLNPGFGLILAGQGAYHEHVGPITEEARYPGETILIDQARYTGSLDVGFNLLAPFGIENHVFSLSLSGAVTQLPVLAAAAPEAVPSFDKQSYNLVGGTLGYAWLSESVAAVIDATATQASEDEAKLTQARLAIDVYPAEHLALLIGAFARRVELDHCAADTLDCLVTGRAKTTAREVGGFVGVGGVFR